MRPLAEQLLKDGLKGWFDEWVLQPGDSIPAKIEEGPLPFGFRPSDFGFPPLCMSANAFGSDWAQLEAGTFRMQGYHALRDGTLPDEKELATSEQTCNRNQSANVRHLPHFISNDTKTRSA
ncbi:MAG: toll/interleukin-1 receptor domain-containing protein [Verrucomicrobiales bacterium]|nr:toll/interleukin-1 receptor domain-containing protein [Verrucomicrobiales bacterium]